MATSNQPAAACDQETCEGCAIRDKLVCLAQPKDLVDFGILAMSYFIPFFAGMIRGQHWLGLGVYVAFAMLFFGYFEAYILCRHCPAYAEPGNTLRCHANWGMPKLPPYDPRPMKRWEQVAFLACGSVLVLYHIPFLINSQQWLLLLIATWGAFTAIWTVYRTQCNRCFHISCPANHVPQEVRAAFFARYPDFARAWHRSGDQNLD